MNPQSQETWNYTLESDFQKIGSGDLDVKNWQTSLGSVALFSPLNIARLGITGLVWLLFTSLPAWAITQLGRGPNTVHGGTYPYTQTITDGSGTCDVIMDGTPANGSNHLYVSTLFDTIGIMKVASGASVSDERQINSDEVLKMTITNLKGASFSFNRLTGSSGSTYFATGTTLWLYQNNLLVRTINCNGSDSYDIFPPIVAAEGDTISFKTSGNARLVSFEVSIANSFPSSDVPYIPSGAATSNLLDTTISTAGHYYVTADWTALAHQPNGVVVKVGNGDAVTKLYYLGAKGPNTSKVDFDLLLLEPGDTVKVVAGLTGAVGEDPAQWTVALTRRDSWSGSRYEVPVVPLGLASPPSGLDMYRDRWPKSSGFRNDFRAARGQNTVFAFAAETLGHSPKCFSEELVNSDENIPIMQAYAQTFPTRQALFHWNGQSVKPWLGGTLPAKMSQFKPYHFRYKVGTTLTSAITATSTVITVGASGLFTTDVDNLNIAIIIPVDATTGARQFEAAELVTVTAISGNQLTVMRNRYKSVFNYTSAGSFAAGSYIAPASQMLNNTLIENGGLRYNNSLLCPVDPQGRTGADASAEMLSYEFVQGQHVNRLHGIMFDVLQRTVDSNEDCNLDGVADGGLDPRGVDLYHLGVQGLARKLRAALPGRIFTFDGIGVTWPALHTVFSGMESEGFDRYNDSYTQRWSSGVNYYLFTKKWNKSRNAYSFCTTKQEDEPPAAEEIPLRRYHTAGLTAMGIAVSHEPYVVDIRNGPFYARDEIRKGVENKLQWLGSPVGPLIRPGLSAPDQLGGASLSATGWSSPNGSATVSSGAEGLVVTPVETGVDHNIVIEYSGITIPAGDLLLRFEGKGGLAHLSSDTARNIQIEVDGRANTTLSYATLEAAVNNEGFTECTAFFRNAGAVGGSTVKLRLIIEGATTLTLRNFTIHNAPDTMLREFENGAVICNSSHLPKTFDLAAYFPGQSFKRIQGQSTDDPVVNDGSVVGSTIQLDGYRGIFLQKVNPSTKVVGFDRTGQTANVSGRSIDASDTFGAAWLFSDTVPLVTSANGTNAAVYGGAIMTWSVGKSYAPTIGFVGPAVQLQVNPANGSSTTAQGMLVWRQDDFLSGKSPQAVSMASRAALSCLISSVTGASEFRMVAKQDGKYYVSRSTISDAGDFTVLSTTTDWALINTSNYSIGTYAPLALVNIEAAGIYFSVSGNTDQSLLKVSEFDLSVPSAGVYASPSHYGLDPGSAGSDQMTISWYAVYGLNYQLQSTTDLLTGSWQNYGGLILGTGSQMTLQVPIVGGKSFYRVVPVVTGTQ